MKTYFSYNEEGYYTGTQLAKLSEKDEGNVYLLPRNATYQSIPENIPEHKTAKYNKIIKVWEIVDDPKIIARNKKIQEAEIDEFGVEIYKKGNGPEGELILKSDAELLEERRLLVKMKAEGMYNWKRYKLTEICADLIIDPTLQTNSNRNFLKNYKDKLNEVWNSIDGTIKAEDLDWPTEP